MNWRPLKVVGDLTGIALGLYCAYRLVHAFAFGEFYDGNDAAWTKKLPPDDQTYMLTLIKLGDAIIKPGDFIWWRYLDTVVQEWRWGSRYDDYTALFQKWFKKNPPPQRFYIKEPG